MGPSTSRLIETLRDESGQTVILAACCMALLLGFLALAVDVGLLFHARRVAQTAADSAAIAGADEALHGDAVAAARADAAANGVSDGVDGASVAVNQPPQSGPYAGNAAYVEVITRLPQSTYFMRTLGTNSINVMGRAVAALAPTDTCIYTLDPTGTNFTMSGGSRVQLPGCSVMDNSSSSAALSVSGGSTLTAASLGVVGGYSNIGGSSVSPTPVTGIAPLNDPLADLPPPPFSSSSCLPNPYIGNGATVTLGSGGTTCFNGLSIAGGSTVHLNSGTYVINGAFTLSNGASVGGTSVTIYLPPGGSVTLTGGSTISLVAPTSGTYNGILFYEDRSDTQTAVITGGADASLEGILYFPSAKLALNGGTNPQIYASVIAGSLQFSGGTLLRNYALVNRGTPLASPRLTE